jgi:sulfur-oxidizing protein SoxB
MTLHWESTYGEERVKEIEEKDFAGQIDIVAQNVKTTDFGDPVFKPFVMKNMNGVPVAIIGQAFPYTPIANPRWQTPNWSFGIQDDNMQKTVDEARAAGAQVVVVLSHNGMDVDLKMASRVRGIDAILGGHTHDGMPAPVVVKNAGGQTLVTNAGSNGKFLGVLDFDVKNGKIADFRYKLLPVFANLLPADKEMQALIDKARAPLPPNSTKSWPSPKALLYRRGNFNGTFDQLILDALMKVKDAEIAFSPGFRWGTSLLPGPADPDGACARPDRDHLPVDHGHQHERRDDQDHPRRRLRQPLQPRPLLPAGRRHGARRRPAIPATRPARWASASRT